MLAEIASVLMSWPIIFLLLGRRTLHVRWTRGGMLRTARGGCYSAGTIRRMGPGIVVHRLF